jgi:hypothetical protein
MKPESKIISQKYGVTCQAHSIGLSRWLAGNAPSEIFDCEPLKEIGVWEQCPYCYEEMKAVNIVGEGEYPIRLGHNPGGRTLVYECPSCFEKSFCHYSEVLLGKEEN